MVPVSMVVLSSVTSGFQDFWVFYRRYTDTTVHTASTAALAIFGILVFVDPWFAAVAIFCYVVPPIALYVLADDPVPGPERPVDRRGSEEQATETRGRAVDSVAVRGETARSSGEDGGSRTVPNDKSEAGDADTDSDIDSDDGDTDSDSDGTDTDSDSDGTDTDSDSDSDDGDTDSDSDD